MSHSEKIELFKKATIKFNKNHNLINQIMIKKLKVMTKEKKMLSMPTSKT